MQQHSVLGVVVAKPAPGIRPMVLIVDDERSIRHLLGRVLGTRGFEVHMAASAAHAMKLADILRFDAAVIDLAIPETQSGLDLIAWLRSHRTHHSLPVLILTGHLVLPEGVQDVIRRQHAYVFYKGNSLAALIDYLKRLTRTVVDLPSVGHLVPSAA